MKVEQVEISKLKAAKYNPRQISGRAMQGLAASLGRFGIVQPVVANSRNMTVVGGHQRIKAAERLGLSKVPVVWVDLPDDQEKALNVALNSPAIAGEFTDDLQQLLDSLAGIDGYDDLLLADLEVVEMVPGFDPDDEPASGLDEAADKPMHQCPNCGHTFEG